MNFVIPPFSSRTVIVGATGSGKSVLAKRLTGYHNFVIVYDTKGLMKKKDFPNFTICKTLNSLIKCKTPNRIYQPIWDELPTKDNQFYSEKFFEWVYKRKNTCLWIDEVFGLNCGQSAPSYYLAILTRGRERGITCFSLTQRPSAIPQVVLSESEFYFVFRLRLKQDKEKIRFITGISESSQDSLKNYEFLIADESDHSLRKRKLSLS